MADEQPPLSEEEVERASTLLDIRRIIGGVLGLYGLLLLGAGLFGSEAEKDKAAGVNINLWVALVLIVVAALFFVWAASRPLVDELEDEVSGAEPGRPGPP